MDDNQEPQQHKPDPNHRQFDYGQPYPKRPQNFLFKFFYQATEPNVAKKLKPAAVLLLLQVLKEEDAQFFGEAALFTDEQLLPLLGITSKTLVAARKRCVDHGWLHFEPGWPGVPSRYWVETPLNVKPRGNSRWRNSSEVSSGLSSEVSSNVSSELSSTLIPIPRPIPIPTPKPVVVVELEKMIQEAGIGDYENCLRIALEQGRTPQQIRERVQFFLDRRGAWEPGYLYTTLTRECFIGKAADSGWMMPNAEWTRAQARAATAEAARKESERVRRAAEKLRQADEQFQELHQTEIDFEKTYGSLLDEMTDQELRELIAGHPKTAKALECHGRRSAMNILRPIFLKAMHERAHAN